MSPSSSADWDLTVDNGKDIMLSIVIDYTEAPTTGDQEAPTTDLEQVRPAVVATATVAAHSSSPSA